MMCSYVVLLLGERKSEKNAHHMIAKENQIKKNEAKANNAAAAVVAAVSISSSIISSQIDMDFDINTLNNFVVSDIYYYFISFSYGKVK